MGTKTFDNANDLITFSRASGGTALRKISYGSELVTNGTFDADLTGWTVGTGGTFSWVDGTIEVTGPKNSTAAVGFTTVIGNTYRASGEHINNGTGGWIIKSDSPTSFATGQVNVTPDSATYGVSSVYFVATSTTTYLHLLNLAADTVGKFDNISVKEVLFDQPAGTLTLYNHPNDIPRIEYDAAGAVKGLLIEEARTNLLTYSEDFTNGAWLKFNSATVDGATGYLAPNGTGTADKLYPTSTQTADCFVYRNVSSLIPVGTLNVCSFFAKAGEKAAAYLTHAGGNDASKCFFDLSTGETTLGNFGSDPFMVDVGSGWWFCGYTRPTNSTWYELGVADTVGSSAVIASGTDGIYIYGAQLEAGSFPSSYISTSGATATRAADIASIPTSAFGYNQRQGSVYVDGTFRSGDTIVTLGSTTIAADADGVKDYTTTYSADPSATGMVLNRGTYKDVKYYPRRLTNAQLQELTT